MNGRGSCYFDSGVGTKSVSDAAKIANVALERDEICLENDSIESNMKQIFGRQAEHYRFVVGRGLLF